MEEIDLNANQSDRGNKKVVLDDDRVGRLLFRMALPAFIGFFVMTLYNVVDTIFVGRIIGSLAIAGLSIVFPFQMLTMGIGQMVGMGSASVISRLLGKSDKQGAEHTLGNALTLIVIFSVLITGAVMYDVDFWLGLLGASDTILPFARDYLVIIVIGLFFPIASMSLNQIMRSEGNARVPMIGMIIGASSNIVLDTLFIVVFSMGIRGAALATVVAQLLSFAFMFSYYLWGKSYLKIKTRNLVLKASVIFEIMKIGIASFARSITSSVTAVFVNHLLIMYGGDIAVSAFGIINRVMMFVLMPAIVIGQGMQPILGFNYGAGRFDRAIRVIKLAFISSTIVSVLVFFVLRFMPEPIVGIFTTESALISLASDTARVLFMAIWLIGIMMVGSLIFQSLGYAVQSFVTALARSFLFLLPLIFILPNYWQLKGVWAAYPLADVCTAVLTVALLIPLLKQLRQALCEQQEKEQQNISGRIVKNEC